MWERFVLRDGPPETGELFKELATGRTHIVRVVVGERVETRGLDNHWVGSMDEFEAAFERIPTDRERELQRPSEVRERQTGRVGTGHAPKAESRVHFAGRADDV